MGVREVKEGIFEEMVFKLKWARYGGGIKKGTGRAHIPGTTTLSLPVI